MSRRRPSRSGLRRCGQRHAARASSGIRQRQQVMEMGGAPEVQPQMLGHEHRGEACDGALELVDMVRVQRSLLPRESPRHAGSERSHAGWHPVPPPPGHRGRSSSRCGPRTRTLQPGVQHLPDVRRTKTDPALAGSAPGAIRWYPRLSLEEPLSPSCRHRQRATGNLAAQAFRQLTKASG